MSNKHFISTLRLIYEDDESYYVTYHTDYEISDVDMIAYMSSIDDEFPSFVSFYANEEASDRKEIEAIYLTDADAEHMNEIIEVEFVACNPARISFSNAPIFNYHNYTRILERDKSNA